MDFFSYLNNVLEKLKNSGKTSDKTPKNQLDDYIKNYDLNAAESSKQGQNSGEADAPDVLSDEEILKSAESDYADWLKKESEYIDMDYANRTAYETLKKQNAQASYDDTLSAIGKSFESALEKSKNASIKQGIARSSIDSSKEKTLDDAKEASILSAEKDYNADIKKIDLDIASLEIKRRKALNELDYEYASLIDSRIKKLKDERQSQLDAFEKANNPSSNSSPAVDSEKKVQDIYLKADELLGVMSAQDARAYVKDNEALKLSLTPYYYYKLYKKYA